jgi:hypothetical protein
MASLKKLQEVLNANADALKAVPGCSGVKRIVCGGCQDFKIITAVSAENFGDWEVSSEDMVYLEALSLRTSTPANQHMMQDLDDNAFFLYFPSQQGKSFAPEADILAAMKAIEGVSTVETQTYTFMDV